MSAPVKTRNNTSHGVNYHMASSQLTNEVKAHLMIDEHTHDQPLNQFRLKHRTKSIWFVAFYALLLLLPWSLTVVINTRPIGGGSYFDQAGSYHPSQFDKNVQIIGFINVINALSAVLALPIIDSVLSQAVVAFTQRKNPHQALNLCQTLVLADRGWKDLGVWYRVFWYRKAVVSSRLLMYATVLVIIGAYFVLPHDGIPMIACFL